MSVYNVQCLSCLLSQKLSSACVIIDTTLHRSSLYRTLDSQQVARASTAVLLSSVGLLASLSGGVSNKGIDTLLLFFLRLSTYSFLSGLEVSCGNTARVAVCCPVCERSSWLSHCQWLPVKVSTQMSDFHQTRQFSTTWRNVHEGGLVRLFRQPLESQQRSVLADSGEFWCKLGATQRSLPAHSTKFPRGDRQVGRDRGRNKNRVYLTRATV